MRNGPHGWARSAACLLLCSVSLVPSAWADSTGKKSTYEVLHSFSGTDGENPREGVGIDPSGNVVGTTNVGGTYNVGTAYKIAPDGTYTTLYSFCDCLDAQYPQTNPNVAVDKSGNFYGTAAGGALGFNYGAVFEISAAGTESLLYNFTNGTDSSSPSSVIVEKKTGNLYGTANNVVFKLTPSGTLTILHDFNGGADGQDPFGGLYEDKKHNLYGTTVNGGTGTCELGGCGTIYKITPKGTETVLYSFTGESDGSYPTSTLVPDAAGNLYGATGGGGQYNVGTLFKLAPDGTFTTLYTFTGGSDGYGPWSPTIDKDGNLYTATYHGGANGKGAVVEFTAAGTETVLHSFGSVANDGAYPYGGVTLKDGWLYGTTLLGGTSDDGAVFKVKK